MAGSPDGALSPALDDALTRLEAEMIDVRRDLHAHPELSWAEERTTGVVAKRLADAGIVTRPLQRTGLVAEIGPETGPVVVLRADLDALPVDDRTNDPWRSTVAGVAHACGHDVHTSALLGAGLALADLGERLPARVRLVFQPAEEIMPGGALLAIEDGVLDGRPTRSTCSTATRPSTSAPSACARGRSPAPPTRSTSS